MKRKIVLTLVCSLLLMTGCGKGEASNYQKGIQAIETGDYAVALDCLSKAEEEESNLKKVYRAEGMATLSTGEYNRAIDYFTRGLNESNGLIESMDIDISYYLAVAFYKSGNVEEASRVLDNILVLRQSDIAYYLRGKIKLKSGNLAGALEDYDKAISLKPNEYDHYLRMYEDLQGEGYEEESKVYIAKAKELGNKLSDYKKGILEYYEGSYSEARNHLENARKSKEDPKLLLYLGKSYEGLGDLGYAVNIYEEALRESPSSGLIYNQLAGVKIKQKDYNGALEIIDTGLVSCDGEAMQSLMYKRIVASENLGDFSSAAKYMEEYLSKYPDDAKAQREYIFLKTR